MFLLNYPKLILRFILTYKRIYVKFNLQEIMTGGDKN